MFSFFSRIFDFFGLKCGFFSISGCFFRLIIWICWNVLLLFGFNYGLFSPGCSCSFKSSKLGNIDVPLQDIFRNSWMASKSDQWFKSYGYFTEGVDFSYWWSFSGGGSAINGATPSSFPAYRCWKLDQLFIRRHPNKDLKWTKLCFGPI